MSSTDLEFVYLFLVALLVVLALYLLFQLKLKKNKGKTLQSAIDSLDEEISDKKKEVATARGQLEALSEKLQHLVDLEKSEKELRQAHDTVSSDVDQAKKNLKELEEQTDDATQNLASIKDDLSIFQPVHNLINAGYFDEPDYLFETSERFKAEIKIVRENQKDLIKQGKAVFVPDTIALSSNASYVKKILGGQGKLLLKAFNIECDNLMSLVKPSNFARILERIDKAAADLEKSTVSLQCGFTREYIELKFRECELQYQFKLKDEREKEEQAAIKEQMREEQKAVREFERALAKAQKEEEMFRDALTAARKELELAGDKDKEKLNDRIALLEKQLLEAEESEKRAKSMAEQTRRGHVYIISNIGSFGDDVYKIGLTRRLEPLDRVKELGDASVPFSFDVHAMIYCEDAPALETRLHKEFTRFRVNQVNHRKEFFNVSLDEIKEKALEILGEEVDFKMTALAEDYRESLKLREPSTAE